jgi:hypothetical protein
VVEEEEDYDMTRKLRFPPEAVESSQNTEQPLESTHYL